MKSFISALFLSLFFLTSSAQSKVSISVSGKDDTPLILVDTFRTEMKSMILNVANITSINVLKDSSAISRYGKEGKNGVVQLNSAIATSYVRLDAILDAFHISAEHRNLRVCINKILIERRQLILADLEAIAAVEITTDRLSPYLEDLNSTEKFINIITRDKK